MNTREAVLKLVPNKGFYWAYQQVWSNQGYQNTWNGFALTLQNQQFQPIEASDASTVEASDSSTVVSR